MSDGGGRSDTDADAGAVIADPAIKGERPTDYALAFDRSCWQRRKENDVETKESTSPTTTDTIINLFFLYY